MHEDTLHKLEQAGLTDVGVRRSHNQDAFAVLTASEPETWRERGHLLLVADGMGAHAVGELASKISADIIPHTYQKHVEQGPPQALRRAFLEANRAIHERGLQNPEFRNMGTTTTVLVLRPEGAWVGHVGDSRVYRIRAGMIEQLSYDHSLHWEMARRQRVDPSQIKGVPSNVIVRSLGPDAAVRIDIEGPHEVLPGDIYLLCSDGLSGQVSDVEMGAIVNALPLFEACRFLVDLANLRGGPDNITIVLGKIPGTPTPEARAKIRKARLAMRPPWYMQLPWPGLALTGGIALAFIALLVVLTGNARQAVLPFVMAAVALGTGIFGVYRAHRRAEQEELDDEPVAGPPRVYRQTTCAIDAALTAKLSDTQKFLLEQVRESRWPFEEQAFQKHLAASQVAAERGDSVAAFRELCRSISILTDAIRLQRNRGEVFLPTWEGAD